MSPSDNMMVRNFWPALLLLFAMAGATQAAEFTINPLLVNLDRGTRASEILVRNEGSTPLRMQVQASSWHQDANGQDQYEPADGLLYFPRTMEIPPGDSRIIRVGVKAAPVTLEDAYRVFVEELPPGAASAPPGASLLVLLRVGVPVFIAPAQPERKTEITALDLHGATAEWVVANKGNVHVRADRFELTGLARDGTRLFEQPFQERYVLAGAVKVLRFEIPPDQCARLAVLEATVAGEDLDLKRKLDVSPGSCH
jgi:fimbrial chaperone protein